MNSITQFYVLCDVPNIRGGHGDELDHKSLYSEKSLICQQIIALQDSKCYTPEYTKCSMVGVEYVRLPEMVKAEECI